jgi:two-component system, chemotaxis family, chemotaxis protein CheY
MEVGVRILLVDDSKVMRGIVRRTLRQAGFENHDVVEAANGTEALSEIQKQAPDLVLSDWNMPEMSGIELLKALRAGGNDLKLGFVTSEGTAEMRKLAEDNGACFFVTKPFTVESFQAALTNVIK